MPTGTVKYFDGRTGDGMLIEDGGEDVPVASAGLAGLAGRVGIVGDQLHPGQRVEFSVVFGANGKPSRAVNVRPLFGE